MILHYHDGRVRKVGDGAPVLVVAELSANHAGSLEKAHDLIDVAAASGADAIKLQTYRPKELAELRGGGLCTTPPWEGVPLVELYEQAQTPWEWHAELFAHAAERGMLGFSSTFSAEATAFLLGLNVPCLKVAAREWPKRGLLDLPADLPAVYSVQPYEEQLCDVPNGALLHCLSSYPARCEEQRLAKMRRLQFYSPVVGLSDHSCCATTVVMAVALGAKIIEVHLMLHNAAYYKPPLDAGHSWRPLDFANLVSHVRHAEGTL